MSPPPQAAAPVVVGINGFGFGDANGRNHVDDIGRKLAAAIDAIRQQAGLPATPVNYIPLEGGDGIHRDRLRRHMQDFAGDPAGGLILFGYSDGATTLYVEFREGRVRQALGDARLTFVAFIDLVRLHMPSLGVNIDPDHKAPLVDEQLIRAGKVYYQNHDFWKGHAGVGALPAQEIHGVGHLDIIASPLLRQDLIDSASAAYRAFLGLA